jgi:hypothetical protein
VCVKNTTFGDIFAWELEPGSDKPAPNSSFSLVLSDFVGSEEDCIRDCAIFAGCYKIHYDSDDSNCELHGNEMSMSQNDFAISGKSCGPGFAWFDISVSIEFNCLFGTELSADDLLAILNSNNPVEWITDVDGVMSWSYMFEYLITEDTTGLQVADENQVWITFAGELHFRFAKDIGDLSKNIFNNIKF